MVSNGKQIKIIGMGMSKKNLPSTYLWMVNNADILIGARRHIDQFDSFPGQKQVIDKNLAGVVQFIKEHMETQNVVVLASGDPLYYGIGSYLIKALGPENVEIFPNISTVAAAFARVKEPWQNVRVVSLHGRETEMTLLRALHGHDTVAVYTDMEKTPAWVARFLTAHDLTDFNLCVLERLGTPKERVDWYSLAQAAEMDYEDPNLLILKRNRMDTEPRRPLYIGMPEEWFDHEEGLITKAEVRAVALSKLRLESDHTMWDLGAGSGSVSIEASLFIRTGRIFALEKDPDRTAQIETNKRRFGVHNLTVFCRPLPEGLEDLPAPDRVFVGGGGRRLNSILATAIRDLQPDGIIVVNTVLIESMQTALATLQENGFRTEMIQVQVSRCQAMPQGQRLAAQNPVWIISGQRLRD